MDAHDPLTENSAEHPLDQAIRLVQGDGAWQGATSPAYFAFVGPFGGATAAVLMQAVLQDPARAGDPVSLTVNYAAAIQAGPFRIVTRLARATRTMQHWSMELVQGADAQPLITASAVLARRDTTWSHQVLSAPPVPAPQAVAPLVLNSPSSWVGRYDMRFVEGLPMIGAEDLPEPASARSVIWLRDAPDRVLDFPALAALGDAFFARVFHVRGRMRPFGTISMTTYFHAGAADLPAAPGAFVLGVADARTFHRGFGDQTVELFDQEGRLLATSHQVTFFRD